MSGIQITNRPLPLQAAFKIARNLLRHVPDATYPEVRSVYKGARIGLIAFRCKAKAATSARLEVSPS